MSQAMDWTTLPLAGEGRSLVEASAGTGKTWTIGALYLRLILEQGLTPRRIVVSTFTNAAASELAERLRAKLLWALAESGQHGPGKATGNDEAMDSRWLRARWLADASTRQADVVRIQAALAEFDAAPISTLHSLCSRILADHPFAAGALFRGREIVDARMMESAIVTDLWRVISQGNDVDRLASLARQAQIAKSDLAKYVPALLQPNVVIESVGAEVVLDSLRAVIDEPTGFASEIRTVLGEAGVVSKGSKLAKAWLALANALEGDGSELPEVLATHLETLASAGEMVGINKKGLEDRRVLRIVEASVKIAATVPNLTLDLALQPAVRQFLAAAQTWCRQAMVDRLDAAQQSTFDQLLTSVRGALADSSGHRALADALFEAWPVALVDEFQDTDPVQFSILDAIYRKANGDCRGRLVMIGDPKQAIYRFRGGDVDAYNRAACEVAESDRLTLSTNFRSSRGYVAAVNQFYAKVGETLGPEGSRTPIRYEHVTASSRRDNAPLVDSATGSAVGRPLVLHVLDQVPDDANLEDLALRACAGQIVKALSEPGYTMGAAPAAPGDIAVLLPAHAQIAKLSRILKSRGVPSVCVSPASVFESAAARDLQIVLYAVLHPGEPQALRAAMATRLWGASLGQVYALRHQPQNWDAVAARFHALHDLLDRRGPQAVVNALLATHAPRLLDSLEGERLLTDLRHCGELLQAAWEEFGGGERLSAWFSDQVEGGDGSSEAADARSVRLESDAGRVTLMTLHVSKGLEFPIVFLPLMWKHTRNRMAKTGAHLLSDVQSGVKNIVLGPAKQVVVDQEYEERFRMLYVALTRAIYACHVHVLGPEIANKQTLVKDAPINSVSSKIDTASAAQAMPEVEIVRGWALDESNTWKVEVASSNHRIARALPGLPSGPLPMRHSFTTLTNGGRKRVAEEEGAAEDEAISELPGTASDVPVVELDAVEDAVLDSAPSRVTRHPELDGLAAVAGADFGNAVHTIFELRTPHVPLTQQLGLIASALRDNGVRIRDHQPGDFEAKLAARLQAVLETPLGGVCQLMDLGPDQMCAELEFNYALSGVSIQALRSACDAHGEAGLVPMRSQALAGLMNGKIDLIFSAQGRYHVLDYKGNRLSRGLDTCLEDYAPDVLEAKMKKTGYRLQALLYTVAVERYLRERLGDGYQRHQHLGDCWYLFVRAVGLSLPTGTPCGIWRHRFDDRLLDAVQAVLGADAQEEAA